MTTSEVMTAYGIPRQTLQRWRRGSRFKKQFSGSDHEYKYEPELKKGLHWKFDDGKVVFTDRGVEKIKQLIAEVK